MLHNIRLLLWHTIIVRSSRLQRSSSCTISQGWSHGICLRLHLHSSSSSSSRGRAVPDVAEHVVEHKVALLLRRQEEGLGEFTAHAVADGEVAGDKHGDAAAERLLRVHRLDLRPRHVHGHDLLVDRLHGGDGDHVAVAVGGRAAEAAGVLVEPVHQIRRLVQDLVVLLHERVAHHLRGGRRGSLRRGHGGRRRRRRRGARWARV